MRKLRSFISILQPTLLSYWPSNICEIERVRFCWSLRSSTLEDLGAEADFLQNFLIRNIPGDDLNK
jgi:hypothetical protein